jgi:hypothetical protein
MNWKVRFAGLLCVISLSMAAAGQDQDSVAMTWSLQQGEKLSLRFQGKVELSVDREETTSLRFSGTAELRVEQASGGEISGTVVLNSLKMSGRYQGMNADLDFTRPVNPAGPGATPSQGPAPVPGGGGIQVKRAEELDKGGADQPDKGSAKFVPARGGDQLDLDPIGFAISSGGNVSFDTRKLNRGGVHLVLALLFGDLWAGTPSGKVGPKGTWTSSLRIAVPKKGGTVAWEAATAAAKGSGSLESEVGERCLAFTQAVEADSKSKNKVEATRRLSFALKGGYFVKFEEKSSARIENPTGEAAKGRLTLEREVTASR